MGRWGGPVANRRFKGGRSSYEEDEDRLLDRISDMDRREKRRSALVKELDVGQVREGVVKSITDFGAFIDLGGIDGLLHISNMSWGRVRHASEIVETGDTIDVKVLEIDWDRDRISLGLKQITPCSWTDIAERYEVGARVQGKVVSVTNKLAIVELQKGIVGLVHRSIMSWGRVGHPSKLVAVGDIVETVILKVDPKDEKIFLGMKQIEADPWPGLPDKYPAGSKLTGTVRNLTSFGAFVEVEPGIDGMIHISDMSWTRRVEHPSEIVRKGDEAEVMVLKVDRDNKRISLGIKQLHDDPWPRLVVRFPKGHEQKASVACVQDGGVVVNLGDDVEGFMPGSRSGVDADKLEDYYRTGESVRVRVTASDPTKRRIVLEVAELAPLPASPTKQAPVGPTSWEDVENLFEEVTAWLIEELKQERSPWTQPWEDHQGPMSVRIGGQPWPTDWPSNIRSPAYRYNTRNQTLLAFQMHKRGRTDYRSNLYVTPETLHDLGVRLPVDEPYFIMTSFPVGHSSRRRHESADQLGFHDGLREGDDNKRQKELTKDEDGSRKLDGTDFRSKTQHLYHVEQVPNCETALGFSFVHQHRDVTYHQSDGALKVLERRHGLRVVEGKPYARYNPRNDIVSMPTLHQFVAMQDTVREGESHYWSTMWHEVVHWTGHSSRLKRPSKSFRELDREQQYAVEELVAESGAAYLCSHFGIKGRLQHGAYLGSWLERVETDRWLTLMRALGDAQRATKWIINAARREKQKDDGA